MNFEYIPVSFIPCESKFKIYTTVLYICVLKISKYNIYTDGRTGLF